MARRPAAPDSLYALSSASRTQHLSDRLCDDANSALLFSDHCTSVRRDRASSSESDLRHIQLLEHLLTPLAKQRAPHLATLLIESFGGLSGALQVEPENVEDQALSEACRIVQAAHALIATALNEQLSRAPVSSTDEEMITYIRMRLQGPTEKVIAVFLDGLGRYLRLEAVSDGLGTQVSLPARYLFSRAFQLSAKKIILAHNHPSGNCHPSSDDIASTQSLAQAGKMLDLEVVDHLVIGDQAYFSFKAGGLL